jgi:hypothetical protein
MIVRVKSKQLGHPPTTVGCGVNLCKDGER